MRAVTRSKNGSKNLSHAGAGEGDLRDHHTGPNVIGQMIQRVAAGVVFLVRDKELVALFESQGSQYGVHAGSGIRHENEIFGIGAKELCQGRSGLIQHVFKVTNEELNRLALQTIPRFSLKGEDGARAAPKRTVV